MPLPHIQRLCRQPVRLRLEGEKMVEKGETIRLKLARKCSELERKQNLFASSPPRATFREILDLEHEIAGLRFAAAQIAANEGNGLKGT
jgi:hypothetical protein